MLALSLRPSIILENPSAAVRVRLTLRLREVKHCNAVSRGLLEPPWHREKLAVEQGIFLVGVDIENEFSGGVEIMAMMVC